MTYQNQAADLRSGGAQPRAEIDTERYWRAAEAAWSQHAALAELERRRQAAGGEVVAPAAERDRDGGEAGKSPAADPVGASLSRLLGFFRRASRRVEKRRGPGGRGAIFFLTILVVLLAACDQAPSLKVTKIRQCLHDPMLMVAAMSACGGGKYPEDCIREAKDTFCPEVTAFYYENAWGHGRSASTPCSAAVTDAEKKFCAKYGVGVQL